ncbi:ferritin-like domain-containing protein [Rhodomicrobium sp.]|uniref:ferritin-like domain-containing protein n=1 Tax=Rhodomicrobium sp. TaxID=2720632 RepID=UPI0039E45F13
MDSVEEFLAYSIKLEQEATLRFAQLADAMDGAGNREVGKLFRQLSEYSRLHMGDAMARAGYREIPKKAPGDFEWPDLESPEAAAIWGTDPLIGREQALEIALDAEVRGYQFYKHIYDTTTDPEIKVLAKEFVAEEEEHVAELKRWMALHKAGETLPQDTNLKAPH